MPYCRTDHRRRGFTMVELLVTIGIIITLASIALPVVLIAKRKGTEARLKSDLSLIGTAIDAYKQDFGDIPRYADAASDQAADAAGTNAGGQWLDYATDRGARLLCFALMSPGPESAPSGGPLAGQDGASGPGFRVRRNMAGNAGPLQGKVYGPYVQSEKFKLEFDTTGVNPNMSDAKLLDVNGFPILYYPGLPGIPLVTNPGTYVAAADPKTASGNTPRPLYNAIDNTVDSTPSAGGKQLLSIVDMQTIMNADPVFGAVLTGTAATYTGPYLLWTAGIDGKFGLDKNTQHPKTDDITNFEIPAQMRR